MAPDKSARGYSEIVDAINSLVESQNTDLRQELWALLAWLDPNDLDNNHQLKPPSFRIKGIIRAFGQLGVERHTQDEFQAGITKLLREYYIFQVRQAFFSRLALLTSWKEAQKFERYVEFPLQYVALFDGCELIWVNELRALRSYLWNRQQDFRSQLRRKLEALFEREDYDLAHRILDWIDECQASSSSSQEIVLDILVENTRKFCNQEMASQWHCSQVVERCFQRFVKKYWTKYQEFLQGNSTNLDDCIEILYDTFKAQFVSLRIENIYDICVTHYPMSKPSLLELKGYLKNARDFSALIVSFLSKFTQNILNPGVTTIEALWAYVRTIKSFLTLDPSGRYLNSVTMFVKFHLQDKPDLVIILLFAILNLPHREMRILTRELPGIDIEQFRRLTIELRNDEYGIESSHNLSGNSEFRSDEKSTFMPDEMIDEEHSNSGMHDERDSKSPHIPLFGVIDHFMRWTPEPIGMIASGKNSKSAIKSNLLDILLDLFESKSFFIQEFTKLLSRKLISLRFYKLDSNWSKCLQIIREKCANKTLMAYDSVNSEPQTNNDDVNVANIVAELSDEDSANVNRINIMLWDITSSKEIFNKLHGLRGISHIIFPKIVSYRYWREQKELTSGYSPELGANSDLEDEDSNTEYVLEPSLYNDLVRYSEIYSKVKPGQTLLLFKDKGSVDLELECDDGYTKTISVSLEQYSVISQFNEKPEGWTLENLSMQVQIDPFRLQDLLDFWISRGVLKLFGSLYKAVENNSDRQDTKRERRLGSSDAESNDSLPLAKERKMEVLEVLPRMRQFITTMLNNLGPLPVGRIHAFLQLTVSREAGYRFVTQEELQTYLDKLVNEKVLLMTEADGLYHL